jgi:hypothetical protein
VATWSLRLSDMTDSCESSDRHTVAMVDVAETTRRPDCVTITSTMVGNPSIGREETATPGERPSLDGLPVIRSLF